MRNHADSAPGICRQCAAARPWLTAGYCYLCWLERTLAKLGYHNYAMAFIEEPAHDRVVKRHAETGRPLPWTQRQVKRWLFERGRYWREARGLNKS